MANSVRDKIHEHLNDYRSKILGVPQSGLWKGEKRGHILPLDMVRMNILQPYRQQFWAYWEGLKGSELEITLHQYFAHLNSSQAMCFNLMYPFIEEESLRGILLSEILGLASGDIQKLVFEHVHDGKEGTNFDFFIETADRRLFFEFKLTERDFGKARNDKRHLEKLAEIYRPKLEGRVFSEALVSEVFFKNYQLMRNITHLRPGSTDLLFVVFPSANINLAKEYNAWRGLLSESAANQVVILPLDEIHHRMVNSSCTRIPAFKKQMLDFKQKYFLH